MKTNILIVACLVVASLISMPAGAKGNIDSLNLKNHKLEINDRNATVSLSYPQIIGANNDKQMAISSNINRAIFQALVDNAPVKYTENVNSEASLELFCRAVAAELAVYGKERMLEPIPLDFYSTWWAFGNKYVVTIFIEKYTFTGGAHGYTYGSMLNFDAKTGESFDVKIADTTRLLEIAAGRFCKERNLPKNAMRVQTGLFVELADLPMPQNIGFNDKGLVLHYNQYEIAPYSFGAIQITIPYKEFGSLMADDFTTAAVRSGGGYVYNQKMKSDKKSGRNSSRY